MFGAKFRLAHEEFLGCEAIAASGIDIVDVLLPSRPKPRHPGFKRAAKPVFGDAKFDISPPDSGGSNLSMKVQRRIGRESCS
jgi:hypothetical protein